MFAGLMLLGAALSYASGETVVFDQTKATMRIVVVERRSPDLAYHELRVTSPSDELRVTRLTVHPHANVAPESAGPWLDGRPKFSDLPEGTARLFVVAADPSAPFSWTLELGQRHPMRRNDVFDSYRFEPAVPPAPAEYGAGRFTPTELDRRLAAIKERRQAEAAAEDARTLPDRIERALKALADASDHRAATDEEEAEARAAAKEEMRARAQAREARRHALVRGTVDAMRAVRRSADARSEAAQLSIREMASRGAARPGAGRPGVPSIRTAAPSGRSAEADRPAASDEPGTAPRDDGPAPSPFSRANAPSLGATGAACDPALAGRYERPNKGGDRFGWYFMLNADCTGEFCAETLTDWNDGGSAYAYHCDRAQELAKGIGLQKFNWTYDASSDSVVLSGGKNVTYKVHRAGGTVSIYSADKVR